MALAATSRGAGSTNTGGQNTLVITPASNSAAGSLLVLMLAYDNSGANGTDPITTAAEGSAVVDSVGNAWFPNDLDVGTNTAGVANDGVSARRFMSYTKVPLTTSDTITVSFGGTTTVARAWTLVEITAAAGSFASWTNTSGTDATGSSTAPSVTSASANVGDLVLGFTAAQGNASITGDSDTTRGNWSTQQTSGVGSGTAGVEITSQSKVTITSAGTQTYNVTITSAKWVCAVRIFREATNPVYKTRHDQQRQWPIVRAGSW